MAEFLRSRRKYGIKDRPTQTRLKRMSDEEFSASQEKHTGKSLRWLSEEEYNESLGRSRRFQRKDKKADGNKRKVK